MAREVNWNETAEHQEVRRKSEFVRGVEDFARFEFKEYIEESDDRALLICAVDKTLDDSDCASACIALGHKTDIADGLADMMRMEGLKEAFRVAAIRSCMDDEQDMEDMIGLQRRKLRKQQWIFAGTCLWGLLQVALAVLGWMEWLLVVTNMFLIAFTLVLIWHDVARIRMVISRIDGRLGEERKERSKLRRRALDGLRAELKRIIGALRDEVDDDEEKGER